MCWHLNDIWVWFYCRQKWRRSINIYKCCTSVGMAHMNILQNAVRSCLIALSQPISGGCLDNEGLRLVWRIKCDWLAWIVICSSLFEMLFVATAFVCIQFIFASTFSMGNCYRNWIFFWMWACFHYSKKQRRVYSIFNDRLLNNKKSSTQKRKCRQSMLMHSKITNCYNVLDVSTSAKFSSAFRSAHVAWFWWSTAAARDFTGHAGMFRAIRLGYLWMHVYESVQCFIDDWLHSNVC